MKKKFYCLLLLGLSFSICGCTNKFVKASVGTSNESVVSFGTSEILPTSLSLRLLSGHSGNIFNLS